MFHTAMCLTELIRKKKISVLSILFKEFRQKMWMTIGLGILFFGIYFMAIWIGSQLINSQMNTNFFMLMYRNPVYFIYLGLFLFACVSTSIYLVRMVIKYLHNTRHRN